MEYQNNFWNKVIKIIYIGFFKNKMFLKIFTLKFYFEKVFGECLFIIVYYN